jgi:Pyruvate/2-oxoacid:ferredoxin oxidoreductase gamma subunit/NAD-dependent dihydropyrimidine dehydrogenase PreA subunit
VTGDGSRAGALGAIELECSSRGLSIGGDAPAGVSAPSGTRVAHSPEHPLEGSAPALPARPAEAGAGCPLRALHQLLWRLGAVCVGAGCASPAAGGLVAGGGAGELPGREGAPGRRVVLLSADELTDRGAAALEGAARAGADAIVVVEGYRRRPSSAADPLAVVPALAPRWREIDVLDLAASAAAIAEELERPGPAVIVARGRCPLQVERESPARAVAERRCNRCGACLRLGCPAILEGEGAMEIDPSSCAGCGLCPQVCRAGAIVERQGLDPQEHRRLIACGEGDSTLAGSPGARRPLGPRGEHGPGQGAPATPAMSIVLAGVLGQPVFAAARMLVVAARSAGLAARASELPVAGSPGAVEAHVRVGGSSFRWPGEVAVGAPAPMVGAGEADLLLGFEPLEALRVAPLLSPRAFVALCDRLIPTFRMRARLEPWPADLVERLRATTPRIAVVPASALAGGRGVHSAAVLLGLVAALLPIPPSDLEAAIAGTWREATPSREAFARGRAMFERLPRM